jgi:hypothetical protein
MILLLLLYSFPNYIFIIIDYNLDYLFIILYYIVYCQKIPKFYNIIIYFKYRLKM